MENRRYGNIKTISPSTVNADEAQTVMLSGKWNHKVFQRISNVYTGELCVKLVNRIRMLPNPQNVHPDTILYFQCLYCPDCNSSFILSLPASYIFVILIYCALYVAPIRFS